LQMDFPVQMTISQWVPMYAFSDLCTHIVPSLSTLKYLACMIESYVQAEPLISNVRTRQMVLILSCVYRSMFRSSTRWLESCVRVVWSGHSGLTAAPGFSPITFTPASTLGAVSSPVAFLRASAKFDWFLAPTVKSSWVLSHH
jgi:hypothetical protein